MLIYSGIGISIYPIQNKDNHFLSYIIFIVIFTLFGIVITNSRCIRISNENKKELFNISDNQKWIITIFAFVYLFTFVFPLMYPQNILINIFNPQKIMSEFSTVSFSERVINKSNGIVNFITGPLRILVTPTFYLFLYRLRKKPMKFILIYSLPVYFKLVTSSYISRNEILFYLFFIFLYFWIQKIFNRKLLIFLCLIGVFSVMPFLYDFTFLRTGGSAASADKLEKIFLLFKEETSYVNLFKYAENSLSLKNKLSFFIYIFTSPIPNSLLFGLVNPIVLSEIFTHIIIGLNYGDQGYYILLPTVFGEGIMLFGVTFSWIYSIIVSFFYLSIGKIISEFKELKFMLVAFVLDIFRQVRGGSQFVYTSWFPCVVYFVLFLFLLKKMNRWKRDDGTRHTVS